MIDLLVKCGAAAVIAWLATRRITPSNAAWAHRLWLVVALSPLAWLAGEQIFAPLAYAGLRPGPLVDTLTQSAGRIAPWAPAVYAAVTTILLLRVLYGVVLVRRLVAGSRPIASSLLPEGAAPSALQGLDIRVGPLTLPVTAGFLRPVVILPAGWRQLAPAALEVILRHEAAHVRRRDPLVALTCAVAESVLWFNPAVWIAGRQVRWFAEMACDAEAAAAMSGQTYAAELLKLAASWTGLKRPLYAVTAGADTDVGRRIGLLIDELETGWRRRLLIPVLAIALLFALPLSATVRVGGSVRTDGWSTAGSHDHGHDLFHQH